MAIEKKTTIKDVAKLAGVSNGTVDRVLHNRGEVSQKSTEKVLKVIEDLGYEPNFYASMLASKKEHLICCLIPSFQKGEYWNVANDGLIRGGEAAKTFNIKVESFFYDQYNIESFRSVWRKIITAKPSGVVLAPMFKNETHLFTEQLRAKGIPYVYIDSKLEEDDYLAYFGMPMYQSGYLSAYLLTDGCKSIDNVAIIRITRDKNRQSDPTLNRRAGFMDYMEEHYPNCLIHNVFINPLDEKDITTTLNKFFKENPTIDHIVTFNSRIHLVAKYLSDNKMTNCKVIGYDSLSKNISALKEGIVNILITQHTDEQAYNAIQALTDLIVQKKKPLHKDNYMQLDILTKYNSDYYYSRLDIKDNVTKR